MHTRELTLSYFHLISPAQAKRRHIKSGEGPNDRQKRRGEQSGDGSRHQGPPARRDAQVAQKPILRDHRRDGEDSFWADKAWLCCKYFEMLYA